MERGEELGSPVNARVIRTSQAFYPALHTGHFRDGLNQATGLDEANGSSDGVHQVMKQALCFIHLGEDPPSRSLIAGVLEGLRLSQRQEAEATPVNVLIFLIQAAVLLRDIEVCRLCTEPLRQVAAMITPYGSTVVARHLGTAYALLGEPDKARIYYHQAIEVCTKIGFRPELALTRLELAELLLDHYPAERAEAIGHLDFAIRECRDMKMARSLDRALRRREALGA